jgi:peptide/nickel transport system ATP-binding protein
LIADEPTTALDVTVQASIIKLLKKIQDERGLSIIFISHDLALVKTIADNLLVMYKGKVAEYGPTEKVLKNPSHPYTQALISCRPANYVEGFYLPQVKDIIETNPLTGELEQKTYALNKLSHQQNLSEESVLIAKNIDKTYQTETGILRKQSSYKVALDNISFNLHKGECLALVGESGSGKSTIGRILTGLTSITDGEFELLGKESENRGTYIQYIFQDPYSSLNPRKSVLQTITEPLLYYGLCNSNKEASKRAKELLEQVGIEADMAGRYPHEFSGGQRQRICIARCLAANPKIIVCDEAVAALDVSVQAQVLNLLKKLQMELGLSYLFITHDISLLPFIAQRIIVLNQGKIEEYGTLKEVLNSPKSLYTKNLLEAVPV